ncbi:MAG: TetR family transcriptional regulator [Rhodanobacter sp.]
MTDARKSRISQRKQPQQARSTESVAVVLKAAAQVLAAEGAQRFTTARVAERAGVSVGTLYQYFPNKSAILFRLQSDEWRETTDMLQRILEDQRNTPLERLRNLVHAFIRSECEEADMRVALDDAAPLYRDAPEAHAARASVDRTMQSFLRESLPKASTATCAMAGELINRTMSAAGKQFSESPRSATEIDSYADAMSDMFCAYLKDLGVGSGPARTKKGRGKS